MDYFVGIWIGLKGNLEQGLRKLEVEIVAKCAWARNFEPKLKCLFEEAAEEESA